MICAITTNPNRPVFIFLPANGAGKYQLDVFGNGSLWNRNFHQIHINTMFQNCKWKKWIINQNFPNFFLSSSGRYLIQAFWGMYHFRQLQFIVRYIHPKNACHCEEAPKGRHSNPRSESNHCLCGLARNDIRYSMVRGSPQKNGHPKGWPFEIR